MEKLIKLILDILRAVLRKPKASPPVATRNLDIIKKWEGLRLKAYKDVVGIWTIGYGHTKTAKPGMKISEQQAEALLLEDLKWVEQAIKSKVTVPLKQHQYDALCSFIYNVGAGAFGKSTMLRKLNAGDYDGAAKEFPRWNKAGGKVVKGLTNRRLEEQTLFVGG